MVIHMEDLHMRAATVIAVALATFSSFPLTAQQQDPQQQQQQTVPSQQTSPGQQSAPPLQQTTPSAVPNDQAPTQDPGMQANPAANEKVVQLQIVSGELVNKLDSKSAKTGDSVVVKTKESVKTPDGTDIPKGSKLMGTVTGVQARGEGKENAQIAIKFDHAELKGGQNIAIQSVIQSVSPAEGDTSNSATNYGNAPAGAATSGGTMPSVRSGATGNMSNSGANSETNAAPTTSTAAGSAQSGTAVGAANGAPAPGSIVARNGNVAIRMTSIPGILLANNVNGQPFANASGLLLGARRDIHLDGGTQVVLAVATMPGAPTTGGSSMNR
jgi:hypothetical protein